MKAGGPEIAFALSDKDLVWGDDLGSLYAAAAAAQWDPATAIPWQAPVTHPPAVEDALVQVLTYLIENETAALLVPARFCAQVHPHFREVLQLLAIQAADEARHLEVFTRRALLRHGQPGLSTVGGQASLKTLVDEGDFALATFLLSVLGEGSFVLHDVGVVKLCSPVIRATYGALPEVNQLDALKTRRGTQNVTFTAVGYGLQKSFPDAASYKDQALRLRMVATPHLLQINVPGFTGDFSMLLSNNAATGGTCFGDSGGPNFLGGSNVVAGVTSFGINTNCAGTGGVFRMDRQDVLDFVRSLL